MVAKQRFLECAETRCPLEVRKECAEAVDGVSRAMPSVVFAASDGLGQDLALEGVVLDGSKVDARGAFAIELEPGTHEAEARLADGRRQTTRFFVRPGEKYRRIALVFAAPQVEREPPPAVQESRGASPDQPLAIVFAGASLLALSAFTYFAIDGKSEQSALDRCKPACTRDGVNKMRRSYLIADISLGAALVFTGASTYFFVRASDTRGGTSLAEFGVSARGSF